MPLSESCFPVCCGSFVATICPPGTAHLCCVSVALNSQPTWRENLHTHMELGSRFQAVWLGQMTAVKEATNTVSVRQRGLPSLGGADRGKRSLRRWGFPCGSASQSCTFTSEARLLIRVDYFTPYQIHVGFVHTGLSPGDPNLANVLPLTKSLGRADCKIL